MNIDKIINQAKEKYPCALLYRGRLTEEERKILEKKCKVKCSMPHMDGTGDYLILYNEVSE